MMRRVLSHAVVGLMRLLARLPLGVLRLLGYGLGWLLYLAVPGRRAVVAVNLRLCFSQLTAAQRRRLARRVFIRFAQAWLDRAWLWHGSPDLLRRRLRLRGVPGVLEGGTPTVVFAPHFMGLDAGWTALTLMVQRRFTTIYTNQANPVMDAWILRGRQRFEAGRLFGRIDGVKTVVATLRNGDPLYLLPDMNFGPHESLFVPFYGELAATVPSLSRFARLGQAQVVPVLSRMTPAGYDIEVLPAWTNFPTDDAQADTTRMNQELQTWIDAMPEQYYWVHKRFKDRPPGVAPVYHQENQ